MSEPLLVLTWSLLFFQQGDLHGMNNCNQRQRVRSYLCIELVPDRSHRTARSAGGSRESLFSNPSTTSIRTSVMSKEIELTWVRCTASMEYKWKANWTTCVWIEMNCTRLYKLGGENGCLGHHVPVNRIKQHIQCIAL